MPGQQLNEDFAGPDAALRVGALRRGYGGSVRMQSLAKTLNQRWEDGWKLHTIFEQDGNAVMIFEKRRERP